MSTFYASESLEKNLRELLLERSEDEPYYIKSKFLADELGSSPKQVGAAFTDLHENGDRELNVEKWAYTSATTWKVTRR